MLEPNTQASLDAATRTPMDVGEFKGGQVAAKERFQFPTHPLQGMRQARSQLGLTPDAIGGVFKAESRYKTLNLTLLGLIRKEAAPRFELGAIQRKPTK